MSTEAQGKGGKAQESLCMETLRLRLCPSLPCLLPRSLRAHKMLRGIWFTRLENGEPRAEALLRVMGPKENICQLVLKDRMGRGAEPELKAKVRAPPQL